MAAHRVPPLLAALACLALSSFSLAFSDTPVAAQVAAQVAIEEPGRTRWSQLAKAPRDSVFFLWADANGQFADDGQPISDGLSPLIGAVAPAKARIDLLAWLKTRMVSAFPEPDDVGRYNRRRHFGGWVRPQKGDCLNTRAKVLVRDAETDSVKFDTENPCRVLAGDWDDPYSGREFHEASAIQIDHVVPLSHAYYAGAYKWSASKRCHYANFLGSSYHLLAVSGRENMSKSDKAPDQYLPPSQAYRCAYVGIWMRIKAAWELDADPEETRAIAEAAARFQCDARTQTIAKAELEAVRQQAASSIDACAGRDDQVDGQSETTIGAEEDDEPDGHMAPGSAAERERPF